MTARGYRSLWPGMGLLILVALVALLVSAPVLAAGNRYIDPAGANAGDCANIASPCLTLAYAVAQATPGDTIHIAAGTYTGTGNQHVFIDKALTIAGAGPATTILQYDPLVPWPGGGRNGVLEIRASDVTVSDLTIRDAPVEGGVSLWGVRAWKSGGTLANLTFDTVHFLDNAGRGIELHADTTISGMTVQDCLFEDNDTHGIRLSSTTTVDGLDVTGSTFRNNGHSGILQAAGSSSLTGLHVDDSTFEDNGVQAIEFGDAYDIVIENSTFSGGGKGISFIDTMAAGGPIGAVTIQNNTMSEAGGPAVLVDITNASLDEPLLIAGNVITQTAGLMTDASAVDIGLTGAETHAAVEVISNTVTFEGTFGAATAAYGVKLSGGLDGVILNGNVLDGGGIGNNGGEPATSGVYIASTSAKFGAIDATDDVEVATNVITGFVNGVSIYDETGGAFGGLPAANQLAIVRNSIAGNSANGVRSDPANTAAAICNWWGDASGPSGQGPGTGDAVSLYVLFAPWLTTDDLANSLCGGVYDLFVGTNRGGTVGGVHFGDVDILALDRDTGTWSKFFEGRDVNVKTNLTGFTFEPGNCLLLSFDGNEKKLGLGFIKPHDILKFCPTSLGEVTTGTFSVYVDGSDVGLTAAGEKLDALELLPDGRLLLSTKGNFSVKNAANATITGRDEDILIFDPVQLGATTQGSFEVYLDGSDLPGMVKEDITGIYYNPLNGDLHITILGKFDIDGVTGDSSDIITLRPDGLGGYDVLPYWHGPDDGWTYVTRSMHIDLP